MSIAHRRSAVLSPQVFDLRLPDLVLERGGTVKSHRLHGWWWGPANDSPNSPLGDVPTVLLVHALTGGAQAGGAGGWWEPLIGPGRALDPSACRILCFNNLGSFYGSSAPGMPGFPRGTRITLTSVDIANSIIFGLERLGLERVHLTAGGSLGGMIALTLGALDPKRFERLLPIATCAAASAWVVGWNHVAREILRLDPGYPHHVGRGLELARQLAMLTYRAEPGLETTQHRSLPPIRRFNGYRIQSYLEHHGRKLKNRFTAHCYELLLDAMDHHDLLRPLPGQRVPAISRIKAATLIVHVDSDQLFTPAQSDELVRHLRRPGVRVARATLRSPHGHDAFLIEWDQLSAIVKRAMRLPAPRS
jgi:homoserine O-acetyltransferase/O-succinyltransferase